MNTLQRTLLMKTLFAMILVCHAFGQIASAQMPGGAADDPFAPSGEVPPSMAPGAESDVQFFGEQQGMGPGFSGFQRSTGHLIRQQEQVKVIPTSEALVSNLHEVVEDMSVMSRILKRGLERSALSTLKLGNGFTDFGEFFRHDQAMEAIFVEDYGALFLMTVDFPLSAPKGDGAGAGSPDTQKDTTWEEVRQEIAAPGAFRTQVGMSRAPGYGAERIKQVKKEMILALKYASNIRHLSEDAWITVRLSHAADMSGSTGQMMMRSFSIDGGGGFGMGGMAGAGGGFGMGGFGHGAMPGMAKQPAATTLCLRARRSDVKDFAAGTLDAEVFQTRVKVITY